MGELLPCPSKARNSTLTPGTGRPLRETTCALIGVPSGRPAEARWLSPATTVMEAGTASTSTGSVSWSAPDTAVSVAFPGVIPST